MAWLGPSNRPYGGLFPIVASTDGRSLCRPNGQPFLMRGKGDAQPLAVQPQADVLQYLQIVQAQGFNTLWVHVIDNDQDSGHAQSKTSDGIAPFTAVLSGSLADAQPFYDLTTPNEAYFQRLDWVLAQCARMGFWVHLDNFENDSYVNSPAVAVYAANGNTRMAAFGTFLANRYKSYQNILWLTGNDFQTWSTVPADNTLALNVMSAVAATDPNKLQAVELQFNMSGGLDNTTLAPYQAIASAYSYFPSYFQVLAQYNSGVKTIPTYLIETYYDGITYGALTPNAATPLMLRKASYWTMTCGGLAGIFHGTSAYNFPVGWQTLLATTSAAHVGVWGTFFESFANWNKLVPDQANTFLTLGMGTPSGNNAGNMATDAYVTAALTPDGSLGIIYCPASSTITVALSKMRGTLTARWFDPTNGTYSAISGSPFANSGTHSFATPGNNAAGDPDWCLVLQA